MSKIVPVHSQLECRVDLAPEYAPLEPLLWLSLRSLLLHLISLGTPDPVFFGGMTIDPDTPENDPRFIALRDAEQFLDPPALVLIQEGRLRAVQVVRGPRGSVVRVNQWVRGRLTASLKPNPAHPGMAHAGLQFEPFADEPAHSTNTLVFQWTDRGRTKALVLWDVVEGVVRDISDAELSAKLAGSMRKIRALGRWVRYAGQLTNATIKAIYYLEAKKGASSRGLNSRVIGAMEREVLAGLPSRKMKRKVLPLDDPGVKAEIELGAAEQSSSRDEPEFVKADELMHLDRARAALAQRERAIVDRYYAGETDQAIGAALGISQQAVNKVRKGALEKLRRLMGTA